MKSSSRVVSIFVLASFLFSILPTYASEIPLLSWERGKSQNVVLGSGDENKEWRVILKSKDHEYFELRPSLSNKAGFKVYSINIPRDLPMGAYSIVTSAKNSPETLVAAVEILELQEYEITRVPGDLIFILLTLVFWMSSLMAIRGKYFRQITLYNSMGPKARYLAGEPSGEFIEHVHKVSPLERVRINLYDQIPESFLKHLLKSDSRGMHLEFPIIWSSMPVVAFILSATLGYLTRDSQLLELGSYPLALCVVVASIGALDVFSGILAAISFFAIRLWLVPDFSVATTLETILFGLLFFVPALVTSFFTVVVSVYKQGSKHRTIGVFLFDWLAPLMLIHALFLSQRSISGETTSSLGQESLLASAILAGRQFEIFLASTGFRWRKKSRVVEEVDVKIGRLISPFFIIAILTLLSTMFYIWTTNFSTAIALGFLTTIPLFALLVRPTWQKLRVIGGTRRNYLVEIVSVVALSFLAFSLIQRMPLVAGARELQIFIAGLSPLYLYAVFTFTADLGESTTGGKSE